MFCPQCGTAHTPGGRFCGNCGLLLPFAASSGSAASAPAQRPAVSIPAFTLAVVACVFAFGVVFVAASAALRGLSDDSTDDRVSAQARASSAAQGAMSTLLSARRPQASDAGKLK